jgi:hypothetical protein
MSKELTRRVKQDLAQMPAPIFAVSRMGLSVRMERNIAALKKELSVCAKKREPMTREKMTELYLKLVHPTGTRSQYVMQKKGGGYSWIWRDDVPLSPSDRDVQRMAYCWMRNTIGASIMHGTLTLNTK